MRKNTLVFLSVAIALILLIFILYGLFPRDSQQEWEQKALREIDRLLLPAATQNITEKDFTVLRALAEREDHLVQEVDGLIIMSRHKEYAHIVHGLQDMYGHIKYDEDKICPGHALAHYYVFARHNETALAQKSKAEAVEALRQWESIAPGTTNASGVNYTMHYNSFLQVKNRIDQGNSSASEEEITLLADAPCAT